jgi:hypothetical protein
MEIYIYVCIDIIDNYIATYTHIGRMVGGRREKVSLRGGITTYVKSNMIFFGEIFAGGLVVLFLLYRILFVNRRKIMRSLEKSFGVEEK